MSIVEKFITTLMLLFILTFLYGFWDITQGKNNRWTILGVWFSVFIFGMIYFVWSGDLTLRK